MIRFVKTVVALAFSLSVPTSWFGLASAGADEVSYSNASVIGTYTCRLSVFAWPHTADEPLMPNSGGTGEIVADGAGKLVQGSKTLHATWTEEGKSCTFNLNSGRYLVNPDGSAVFGMEWKHWEGGKSDFKCFNITHTGIKNWVDPPYVTNSIVSKGGARIYSSSFDNSGIEILMCDRSSLQKVGTSPQ